LNLSRAIGDHAYKKNNTLPAEEQAITALPDVRTLTLGNEDEFMVIACDGIWNFMSSQDVVDFVRSRLAKKSLRDICEEVNDRLMDIETCQCNGISLQLFTHCLAPNTSGDGTGCDNMTAIIVKFTFNPLSSNDASVDSKTIGQSLRASVHVSSHNKRTLSPDPKAATENTDDNSSKKFKVIVENGTNNGNDEVTSSSKVADNFPLNTATTINNNNSVDAQPNEISQ
jgi:protein phosphatase 1G